MKHAIISLSGKQYYVHEGQELEVNQLDAEPGKTMAVDAVLFIHDGKDSLIGTPSLTQASVTLEILDHHKDDKIRVATYKAKARQRKVHGHRQSVSRIRVKSIA